MVLLLGSLACTPVAKPDSPNVLVVVVEALRADALGHLGGAPDASPAIDALAAESATFTRAYAASPWTLPSTATLLTGQWPWEHRCVTDVLTAGRYGVLPRRTTTVAETYEERGYRTGAWMNSAFHSPVFALDQGFQHYSHRDSLIGAERSASETIDEALEWVGSGTRPFFAVVHLAEPHYGYDPSAVCSGRFSAGLEATVAAPIERDVLNSWIRTRKRVEDGDQQFVRALYAEEVCTADDAVAALVVGLQESEQWDDTWVVVTSDHGESLWDDGIFGHGYATNSILTHVPLVVRIPGLPPQSNPSIVGHVDLVRGLLDESGPFWEMLRTGKTIEGRVGLSTSPSRTLDQISVVTETQRTTFLPDSKTGVVWSLDSAGREDSVLRTYNNEAAVRESPEFAMLERVYGNALEPTIPSRMNRIDVGGRDD